MHSKGYKHLEKILDSKSYQTVSALIVLKSPIILGSCTIFSQLMKSESRSVARQKILLAQFLL